MILLDNQVVNWKTGDGKLEVGIRKQMEDIKRTIGLPVKIRLHSRYVRIRQPDASGLDLGGVEKPGVSTRKLSVKVSSHLGTENWTYCERIDTGKQGNKYSPSSLKIAASLSVNDIELAWFLLYKLPDIEYEDDNGFKKIGRFIVDNPKKEYATKTEFNKKRIKIESYLYNDEFELKEDIIREVAHSYNIPDVHRMELDQVKEMLFRHIKDEEALTGRGFDRFMSAINLDAQTRLFARVRRAIDRKLIKHEMQDNSWYYVDEYGNSSRKILNVVSSENTFGEICEYFMGNKKEYENLCKMLGEELTDKDNSIEELPKKTRGFQKKK